MTRLDCRQLVRTLHRRRDEILAFHTTGGITNARTESTNFTSSRSLGEGRRPSAERADHGLGGVVRADNAGTRT
jgi:hypothetical protein